MSWSVQFIGTPENIIAALKQNSENLTGVSKDEYETALPHIEGLLKLNHNNDYPLGVKLVASGHGYNGNSNCTVSISFLDAKLV